MTSRLGTGKSLTFLYSVVSEVPPLTGSALLYLAITTGFFTQEGKYHQSILLFKVISSWHFTLAIFSSYEQGSFSKAILLFLAKSKFVSANLSVAICIDANESKI